MLNYVLRKLTAPILTPEVHVRYMNFLVKGKISGAPAGGGLGLPLLNPGHTSETLPFATEVANTIPYPSEAGQTVNLSTAIDDAFPGVANAAFDAYRLAIGGLERYTRGISFGLRTYYTSNDPGLQPSSIAFTILQAPVIIYLMTLRRQAGRLYLAPISVNDGLTYEVTSNDPGGIQGTNVDITYQGVSFSDPFFASELGGFDFFTGDKNNGCYRKSR